MTLKLITGGQTGVDRAALDLALARGIPYGGWCPRGGWAEDMPTPPGLLKRYPELFETVSRDPAERTEWNVRDSDAVLILIGTGGLGVSNGTAFTESLAGRYGRPLMLLNMEEQAGMVRAGEWLSELMTARRIDQHFQLGIGGPRESEVPGIYDKARTALEALLQAL